MTCCIVGSLLGGCTGALDTDLTRAKKSQKPIFVRSVQPTDPASYGAVSPAAEFFNTSYKTYKYVKFDVTAYNRVGDVIHRDYDEAPVVTLRFTGPLPSRRTPGETVWRKISYSDTAVCFELKRIGIEHMDGTSLTIEGPELSNVTSARLHLSCKKS